MIQVQHFEDHIQKNTARLIDSPIWQQSYNRVQTDTESNNYHEIWSSILLMPGLSFFFLQSEDVFETMNLIFLTMIPAHGQPHAQIFQKEV